MKVFYYINQLQFSIVRRTALSYNMLYFCLPAGRFMEACVIVILHPPPSRESSGLWGSFKPGWLCGSSLDNARGFFFYVIEDGLSSVLMFFQCPLFAALGAALGMGWGCWCFEFSEESSRLLVVVLSLFAPFEGDIRCVLFCYIAL